MDKFLKHVRTGGSVAAFVILVAGAIYAPSILRLEGKIDSIKTEVVADVRLITTPLIEGQAKIRERLVALEGNVDATRDDIFLIKTGLARLN